MIRPTWSYASLIGVNPHQLETYSLSKLYGICFSFFLLFLLIRYICLPDLCTSFCIYTAGPAVRTALINSLNIGRLTQKVLLYFLPTVLRSVGKIIRNLFCDTSGCDRYNTTVVLEIALLLGRPYGVTGGTYKMLVMFSSFFSPPNLRAPSADRRETLPHDRNRFINWLQKFGGLSP